MPVVFGTLIADKITWLRVSSIYNCESKDSKDSLCGRGPIYRKLAQWGIEEPAFSHNMFQLVTFTLVGPKTTTRLAHIIQSALRPLKRNWCASPYPAFCPTISSEVAPHKITYFPASYLEFSVSSTWAEPSCIAPSTCTISNSTCSHWHRISLNYQICHLPTLFIEMPINMHDSRQVTLR